MSVFFCAPEYSIVCFMSQMMDNERTPLDYPGHGRFRRTAAISIAAGVAIGFAASEVRHWLSNTPPDATSGANPGPVAEDDVYLKIQTLSCDTLTRINDEPFVSAMVRLQISQDSDPDPLRALDAAETFLEDNACALPLDAKESIFDATCIMNYADQVRLSYDLGCIAYIATSSDSSTPQGHG